jgi:hypothetical protein
MRERGFGEIKRRNFDSCALPHIASQKFAFRAFFHASPVMSQTFFNGHTERNRQETPFHCFRGQPKSNFTPVPGTVVGLKQRLDTLRIFLGAIRKFWRFFV